MGDLVILALTVCVVLFALSPFMAYYTGLYFSRGFHLEKQKFVDRLMNKARSNGRNENV
jgi:hypothetical protein